MYRLPVVFWDVHVHETIMADFLLGDILIIKQHLYSKNHPYIINKPRTNEKPKQ